MVVGLRLSWCCVGTPCTVMYMCSTNVFVPPLICAYVSKRLMIVMCACQYFLEPSVFMCCVSGLSSFDVKI